jgi:hypothetical protein
MLIKADEDEVRFEQKEGKYCSHVTTICRYASRKELHYFLNRERRYVYTRPDG